jgi:hypothetical protein
MRDIEIVLRQFISADAAITALVGERVYFSTDLPGEYDPSVGPAILARLRGGSQDYSNQILDPSMQYQCYAIDEATARQVYFALYDLFNDQAGLHVQQSRLETQGQLLRDSESAWPYVLVGFRHWVVND